MRSRKTWDLGEDLENIIGKEREETTEEKENPLLN